MHTGTRNPPCSAKQWHLDKRNDWKGTQALYREPGGVRHFRVIGSRCTASDPIGDLPRCALKDQCNPLVISLLRSSKMRRYFVLDDLTPEAQVSSRLLASYER